VGILPVVLTQCSAHAARGRAPTLTLAYSHTVRRVLLRTADGTQLACDEVVNCAGHGAPRLAAALGGMPRSHVPAAHFAKGTYFALSGRPSPFRGLVYPLPQQAGCTYRRETGAPRCVLFLASEHDGRRGSACAPLNQSLNWLSLTVDPPSVQQQAGLGVHATVDLAGRCRFGRGVEWTSARPPAAAPRRSLRAFCFRPDVEWTSNAEDVQARRGRGPLRILTVAVDVVASSHSRSSTSRSRL